MEASKLAINPDHLRFKPMSAKKKADLRKENIKALIRSKPAGTPITLNEFCKVTHTKNPTVYRVIENMIKAGILQKTPDERDRRRYSYSVTEDVKVKSMPILPTDMKLIPTITQRPAIIVGLDVAMVKQKAKDYAWENDQATLRGFIKWLEKSNDPTQ